MPKRNRNNEVHIIIGKAASKENAIELINRLLQALKEEIDFDEYTIVHVSGKIEEREQDHAKSN